MLGFISNLELRNTSTRGSQLEHIGANSSFLPNKSIFLAQKREIRGEKSFIAALLKLLLMVCS
jgi:hypothetical protein